MEEIDIIICLKKITKDWKNIKKIIVKQKNQQKTKQKALIFENN